MLELALYAAPLLQFHPSDADLKVSFDAIVEFQVVVAPF